MLKSQEICGVEVLDIIMANFPQETQVDVIACCLQVVIPVIIKSYLPSRLYEEKKGQIFDMILNTLNTGNFKDDKATEGLLLTSLIGSAVQAEHIKILCTWFENP